MPTIIIYLLKLSVSLAIVWLFYQLLLRRLTFYQWNRWYLLGYSILSFFIPLYNIGKVVEESTIQQAWGIRYIPALGAAGAQISEERQLTWGIWETTITILAIGSGLLLIRTMVRIMSLRRLRRKAELMVMPESADSAGLSIYRVDEEITPFSFGRSVYINPSLHTAEESARIILHEYIHVRQRHTLDMLLAEGLVILCWFNPFAWLIRLSIRQNLEFIADSQVLARGLDRKDYQYHLLKVVGSDQYRLATKFNYSSLKKRIIMMNKIRSARFQLVKFLFILPLVVVLLVAFRKQGDAGAGQAGRISPTSAMAGRSAVVDTPVKPAPVITPDIEIQPTLTVSIVQDSAMDKANPIASAHVQSISFITGDNVSRTVSFSAKSAVQAGTHVAPGSTSNFDLGNGVSGRITTTVSIIADSLPSKKDTNKAVILIDTAGRPGAQRLYIVDGEKKELGWDPDQLKPEAIESMDVFKGDAAIRMYGDQGKNGVIFIRLKPAFKGMYSTDPRASIYIIEDKVISVDSMRKINPKQIKSLNVIRGDSAVKLYGEKGRNGVIILKLQPATSAIANPNPSSYRLAMKKESVMDADRQGAANLLFPRLAMATTSKAYPERVQ